MANTIRIKKRAAGGAAGAPATLKSSELAFNEQDTTLYYGFGDDGSANATSIISIGGAGAFATLGTSQTITGNKTFSGTVSLGSGATATTPTAGDNTTKVATTAFVTTAVAGVGGTLNFLGDSGSGSVNLGSQSLTISGGTGLTATAASQTLTINLDNTSVSANSYGSASSVGTFTVDAQGRLTAASNVSISITASQVSDFDTQVRTNRLDQMAAPTASVSLNSQKITNLATPTLDSDAATKAYVDAARSGLDVKQSVRLASTANVSVTYSNTGGTSARGQITAAPNTLDGVSLAANDRILLKNQSTGAQNGIWVVTTLGSGANGVWDRATDFDADAEVTAGAFVFVTEGTANADSGWVLTTNDPIVIGGASGTALAFAQFSGAGQITAGAGLTKTGNTIDVVTANSGRIVVNADNIDLATAGTAGTYRSVTTDAYGRVTSGTNPTTLAGYGITDAQPLDATLTALAGVSTVADRLIYATGSDTFTTTTFTSFGRSLVDDADASAARTTLGLGTIATQNANNVTITGGSIDNITIDGGTF